MTTQTKAGESSTAVHLRSILVPTDFSAPSLKALRYAVTLAKQFGGKIILLHVVEPIGATPDFAYNPIALEIEKVIEAAEVHIGRIPDKAKLDPSLIDKTLVRHGVAYSEISETAKELKADIIVIATHGYTGFKHMFMGSTAERVVRHAPCPVLVVRENEREFA